MDGKRKRLEEGRRVRIDLLPIGMDEGQRKRLILYGLTRDLCEPRSKEENSTNTCFSLLANSVFI